MRMALFTGSQNRVMERLTGMALPLALIQSNLRIFPLRLDGFWESNK